MQRRANARRKIALSAGVGIVLAIALVITTLFVAHELPGTCCPPAVACSGRACPLPPPPPPSTLIGAGVSFTVGAQNYDYFSFQLSPATYATLSGTFTTTRGVTLFVMIPATFDKFAASPAAFRCSESASANAGCISLTQGQVANGSVNSSVPIFTSGSAEVVPWDLVMLNTNTSATTEATWATGLIATYANIYL